MDNNFANAGVFLIQTFFGLYTLLLMLRFLLHMVRADFYNPLAQAVVQLTNPALTPLRSFIPVMYRFDLACLLVALAVELVAVLLIFSIMQMSLPGIGLVLAWCALGLFALIFDIYYVTLIIMVIASWITHHHVHPALQLIRELNEPLCAPARRLAPQVGGLDLSVMLVFVLITLVDVFLLVTPLKQSLGMPSGLLLGF